MSCGSKLASNQRYCTECGARRGGLPAAIAARIESLQRRRQPAAEESAAPEVGALAAGETGEEADDGYWRFMPSPEIAAVAVMALLAAGVVLGSVTSPIAASAGLGPIVIEMAEPSGGGEVEEAEEEVAAAPAATAAVPATASLAPEEAVLPPEVPVEEEPAALPPELPEIEEEAALPPIAHVFEIVLEGHGYEEAFGRLATGAYLSKTLAGEGELLSNYYAVSPGGLADEIALLSGQGPTTQTAANCPQYNPVAPGTISVEGQVEGDGCVYPKEAATLPAQLTEAKLTWKAYVEDIGNGAASGQASSCRHPALGAVDGNQAPLAGDAYETWRNPFVYFAGLAEAPECAERDVGLDQLDADLKQAKKTPSLSYIVPNACHDGSETPCAPEQPAGLAPAEAFLEAVVPKIVASPAYKEGGLIAITFAHAPQAGANADPSSCCGPAEYVNVPPATATTEPATGPVKPSGGGGRVGLLLLSPFVAPGSVDESGYYNHFSLLLSIEELFGLTPLGYANELIGFDETVYNSESSTVSSAGSGHFQPSFFRPASVDQDQHRGQQAERHAGAGQRRQGLAGRLLEAAPRQRRLGG